MVDSMMNATKTVLGDLLVCSLH